jgi:uncharacterized repeat protein (TIGR03803 family)
MVRQAPAQTFTVLHYFQDREDGGLPMAGLTMDRAGNFYGTTSRGGTRDGGTVFKMSRAGTGWVLATLHNFGGGNGLSPDARVIFGLDGTLYGTTPFGAPGNQGVVFNLRPPATFCHSVLCPWTGTVIDDFDGTDGSWPGYGDLVFDSSGDTYGTTSQGGAFGLGVVFKLTHSSGGWSETVLYNFAGGEDGASPNSGVTFDGAGNLYGTATFGGSNSYGTIYELSPSPSGWTETTLHSFQGSDGEYPIGGVVLDFQGNLFGTTKSGGPPGSTGTVWQLTPSNGDWSLTTLHGFSGLNGPFDALTFDTTGNLYGTCAQCGVNGWGEVFKLTRSNGGWNYTDLHSFDLFNGAAPFGGVTLDTSGNLYGTTSGGGQAGVVWEITP